MTPRPSTRSSRRRTYLAAGALVVGGATAGALFSPIGLAGAQTDDDDATSTEETPSTDEAPSTDADSTDGADTDGEGRHRGRGHRLDAVTDLLGLSGDEIRDRLEAGESLAEIAGAEGVGSDALVDALVAAADERLDAAVEADRLTADEAEDKLAEITERITTFVNTPGDELPTGGRGGPGHGHRHGGPGRGMQLDAVAESLGLTVDDIRDGLSEGQTLVEVAEAAGVTEEELVGAIVAEVTEQVAEAEEAGRLDGDRADEILAELEDRVTEMVNRDPGERVDGERRGFGGRGFRGGPGFGSHGPTDGDLAETATT